MMTYEGRPQFGNPNLALLKISSSAPQCNLLGTGKGLLRYFVCKLCKSRRHIPLCSVTPFPLSARLIIIIRRNVRASGSQAIEATARPSGWVQVCSIQLLPQCMEACSQAQMQAKSCTESLCPREDVKSPLKAHRCRLVLRQKNAKGCAQSASWPIAAPTGMSHDGNCQQEGDIETVTDSNHSGALS